MSEDHNVVPIQHSNPPPSPPSDGGGRDGLAERMARLETEFKEVVKKSDLIAETAKLERRIQKAVDEVKSATNTKWWIGLGTIAVVLSLCLTAYIAFFK